VVQNGNEEIPRRGKEKLQKKSGNPAVIEAM